MMKFNESKFYSKINKTGNCWVWMGCKDRQGYGLVTGGFKAHRLMMKLNGFSIDGQHVLHKCDNPSCVNPEHLFVGTNALNMADKVSKNRQHKPKGNINPKSKLTDNDVRYIRATYTGARGEKAQFAKQFDIDRGQIGKILSGNAWSHLI